ncbi:MAG: hypothetical protein ACO1SX_18665, partial [Actinomycetota bacterium]
MITRAILRKAGGGTDRDAVPRARAASQCVSQSEFVAGAAPEQRDDAAARECRTRKLDILIIEDNQDYADGLQTFFE